MTKLRFKFFCPFDEDTNINHFNLLMLRVRGNNNRPTNLPQGYNIITQLCINILETKLSQTATAPPRPNLNHTQ